MNITTLVNLAYGNTLEDKSMQIDFEKMEQHAHDLMDQCQTHLNHILKRAYGKELKIDQKFSLETNVNARSNLKQGKYSISLNNGTYIAVQDFYEQRFFGTDRRYYFNITKEPEYDEEIAKKYFLLMMDITLMAFIYHEYGHIYGGHLDHIVAEKASRDAQNASTELDCTETAELTFSAVHHQAMEWNADDFSATRVVEMIFSDSYCWKMPNAGSEHPLQLFWVVANATLVSYSLLGSSKRADNLENSSHLPAKFRALAYICTTSKKSKKWCGIIEPTRPIVEEAIALTSKEMELYGLGYRAILSESEEQHYNLVEYELLVKLPVALFQFQHLQVVTPELMVNTMLALYEAMSPEEKTCFEEKAVSEGKPFSLEKLKEWKYLADHLEIRY